MKIFALKRFIKNPRAEHRVKLHIVAKKNENNSLINGIVKKKYVGKNLSFSTHLGC